MVRDVVESLSDELNAEAPRFGFRFGGGREIARGEAVGIGRQALVFQFDDDGVRVGPESQVDGCIVAALAGVSDGVGAGLVDGEDDGVALFRVEAEVVQIAPDEAAHGGEEPGVGADAETDVFGRNSAGHCVSLSAWGRAVRGRRT